MLSIRVAIARGSTRANFSPGVISTNFEIVFAESGVGAPLIVTVETEKIGDQAKR